jgi:hypothetical protein
MGIWYFYGYLAYFIVIRYILSKFWYVVPREVWQPRPGHAKRRTQKTPWWQRTPTCSANFGMRPLRHENVIIFQIAIFPKVGNGKLMQPTFSWQL